MWVQAIIAFSGAVHPAGPDTSAPDSLWRHFPRRAAVSVILPDEAPGAPRPPTHPTSIVPQPTVSGRPRIRSVGRPPKSLGVTADLEEIAASPEGLQDQQSDADSQATASTVEEPVPVWPKIRPAGKPPTGLDVAPGRGVTKPPQPATTAASAAPQPGLRPVAPTVPAVAPSSAESVGSTNSFASLARTPWPKTRPAKINPIGGPPGSRQSAPGLVEIQAPPSAPIVARPSETVRQSVPPTMEQPPSQAAVAPVRTAPPPLSISVRTQPAAFTPAAPPPPALPSARVAPLALPSPILPRKHGAPASLTVPATQRAAERPQSDPVVPRAHLLVDAPPTGVAPYIAPPDEPSSVVVGEQSSPLAPRLIYRAGGTSRRARQSPRFRWHLGMAASAAAIVTVLAAALASAGTSDWDARTQGRALVGTFDRSAAASQSTAQSNSLSVGRAAIAAVPQRLVPRVEVTPNPTNAPLDRPLVDNALQRGAQELEARKPNNDEQEQKRYARVTGTDAAGLRVRAGPGKDFPTTVIVRDKSIVRIVDGPTQDSETTWFEIAADNGEDVRGWSSLPFIQPIQSFERPTTAGDSAPSIVQGRVMPVKLTAYTHQEPGEGAHGWIAKSGAPVAWGIVAVDPEVIPLGSRITIDGFDQVFRAEDTGFGVRGRHIDIFLPDHDAATRFGVQYSNALVLN